jgi:predicted cupin superfamily sugar epimerase
MSLLPSFPTSPQSIADSLNLLPHPEGGFYKETYRCDESFVRADGSTRSAGTAIYYLLVGDEPAAWHRVASDEIWHYYAGDTLELELRNYDDTTTIHKLGFDPANGIFPQFIIPKNVWQRARCTNAWTLVGCTVNPGFDFDDFEME